MNRKYITPIIMAAVLLFLSSCTKDLLDRPPLNAPNDDGYWKTEDDLRLYMNNYTSIFFQGYNTSYSTNYALFRGYLFSDDVANNGTQEQFENNTPNDVGGSGWRAQYAGPGWNFSYVTAFNIMLDRLENRMKDVLTEEQYNHWEGIGRFYRAMEYSRLMASFGDVPYIDQVFSETDEKIQYQPRTPRKEVLNKVMEDYRFAMKNVRENDGDQYVNRKVVAAIVARWMLFEGTWFKYHYNDPETAKKALSFAVEAAEYLINSGNYEIGSDFRSIFGSQDLKGNKEVVFYRHYDASQKVTHCVASYNNTSESQGSAANLMLAKSFICNDGKVYQNSSVPGAQKLDLQSMRRTRDPRFEAMFYHKPLGNAATLLYTVKFIDRKGPENNTLDIYKSMTNTNDAPVLRYAEVLLNWLEAKAELATMGGAPVTQADIDKAINSLRDRPLDAEAVAAGVKKTAYLKLSDLPNDPDRDPSVSPLLWEIRRERRMELAFEHSRLLDLKRWKKIEYMDTRKYPDLMYGLWIDVPKEFPTYLEKLDDRTVKTLRVRKADGTIVKYDGKNAADMVGFYQTQNAEHREPFTDRVYLAPIGIKQIQQYKEHNVDLKQNPGWN